MTIGSISDKEDGNSVRAKLNEAIAAINESLDGNGNVTAINLTVTENFTSRGIDDNATSERLQIEDTLITIGASAVDYSVVHSANDRKVTISGGSSSSSGANIVLNGGTRASLPGDMSLRDDGDTQLGYSSADSSWDFQGNLLKTTNIAFPSTQVTSSDPNVLDDYEEGTFTPTVSGATTPGSPTLTVQDGFYTKIGNTVRIQGRVVQTSKGGMVGPINFGGLPFSLDGTASKRAAVSPAFINGIDFGETLGLSGFIIGSFFQVNSIKTDGRSSTTMGDAEMDDSFTMYFTFIFQVN